MVHDDFVPDEAPAAPRNLRVELAGDIRTAEAKYGLPKGLLSRMIQTESNWSPDAVSPKGATGILQFMPATAQGLQIDPRDPKQAIDGAGRMLARLNRQYGGDWPKTLAAYNWGEGNVAKHGMEKMPQETRNYLTNNIPDMGHGVKMPAAPAVEDDFVADDFTADKEPPVQTLADLQAKREALAKRVKRARDLVAEAEKNDLPEEAIAPLRKDLADLTAEMKRTGVGEVGRNVGAFIGSIGGGLVGVSGGVPGVVVGGMLGAGAGSAMGSAYDLYRARQNANVISEEDARDMILKGAITDAVFDGAGSLLFLGGGRVFKILSKDPKVLGALRKLVLRDSINAGANTARAMGDAAAKEMADRASTVPATRLSKEVMDAQASEKAVRELTKRTGGEVPTTGQITGTAGRMETVARALRPEQFEAQRKVLQNAANQMHGDIVNPSVQPSAKQFGTKIVDMLEGTEKAVKAANRDAFDAADNAGFTVNAKPMADAMEALLARDKRSAGGVLSDGERGELVATLKSLHENLMGDVQRGLTSAAGPNASQAFRQFVEAGQINPGSIQQVLQANAQLHGQLLQPGEVRVLGDALRRIANREYTFGAEGALDKSGGLKQAMRKLEKKGELGPEFKKQVGDFVNLLEGQYEAEAKRTAKGTKVYNDLIAARKNYREMADTVFDDEMKRALRSRPEEVGRLIWAKGHVSGPEQLQRAMQLAKRNGLMTDADIAKTNADVLRGFLQGAVPDAASAAKWTETLAKDPAKRESFELLTKQTGTQQLAEAMRVMEQAARIAQRGSPEQVGLGQVAGLASRAHAGTLGIGLTTGAFSLPLLGLGMAVHPLTSAYATAITQGNKGIYRDLLLLNKAVGSGRLSKAALGPLRAAYGRVSKWAADEGIDLFIDMTNPAEE